MASLADVVKGVQETNDLLRDNVRANERVQALMANSASLDAAAQHQQPRCSGSRTLKLKKLN